nr:hypothetical protein [uncultured Ruegeria sp.]
MTHEHTTAGDQYRGRFLHISELVNDGFASRKHIVRLLARGELKGFAIGRTHKVDGDSVFAFIQKNAIQPGKYNPSILKDYGKPDAA